QEAWRQVAIVGHVGIGEVADDHEAILPRALLAALGALALFGVAGVALAMSLPDRSALAPWVAIGGFGLGVVACVAIGVALSPKRHVTFYADATKGRPLLRVYQDRRWQLPVATYTIADGADQLLAILRKNVLHDLVRRKWQVIGPDGSLLCHAQEEASIFRCLARRVARQYVPVRINFVFLTPPEPGRPAARLGVFNRKLTLLDRYVLDLSADRAERLDRRVALALGVMLDSAERR
ncbi:MAG TPA: hypothetical protein VD963_05145, partial [Phycisphaerales bacterium]|nr:hypothetical protein [Phycisphaerales bacterium]